MSQATDNPLKRFAAMWLAIGIFAAFAILATVLAPLFNQDEVTEADATNSARRIAVRHEVEAAEAKAFAMVDNGDKVQVAPEKIFAQMGAKLVSSKPAAVKTDKQRLAQPAPEAAPEGDAAPDATQDAATPESTEQATPEQ